MGINSVQINGAILVSGGTTAPVPSPSPAPADVDLGIPRPAEAPANPMEQQAAKAEAEQSDPEAQHEKLAEAVDKLNKTALVFDRSIRFQIHDKTKEFMVAVVDQNTSRVIREIPSKDVLDLVAKMRDYIGLLFDKKA